MARYYVRAEGITCKTPFRTAAEASVWALKNITANGAWMTLGEMFVPFEIMRIEAEGVH